MKSDAEKQLRAMLKTAFAWDDRQFKLWYAKPNLHLKSNRQHPSGISPENMVAGGEADEVLQFVEEMLGRR
jgi:hypothetical protein